MNVRPFTLCFVALAVAGCPAPIDIGSNDVGPNDAPNDASSPDVDPSDIASMDGAPNDGAPADATATDGGADAPGDVGSETPVPMTCGGAGEQACVDPDGARTCNPDAVLMGTTCVCPTGSIAAARRCVRGTTRLVYPPSGSYLTGRNVRFRWVLPDGLDSVRVDVCRTASCPTAQTVTQVVTGAEVTLPVESGFGYWRLRSSDGATVLSPTWFFVARGTTAVTRARVWPGVLMNTSPTGADMAPTVIPLHARHAGAPSAPGEFGCATASTSSWLTAGGLDALWETASLAGDLDGDGTVEYAVAAPLAANGGAVQLRSPCRTSPSTAQWRDLIAPAGMARFGTALGGHGDLDGDGYADLAVAAYDRATGSPRVLVYRGGATGMLGAPAQTLPLPGTLPRMTPVELRMLGDVNGDDRSDLAVALPAASRDAGRVLLWLGSPAGLDPGGPIALEGPAAEGARFGAAVAPAGDLDGDGLVDLAVGAPGADAEAGAVYVFAGAASPAAAPVAVRRGASFFSAGAQCGLSVMGLGDTNGDGRSDLAVACPRAAMAGRTVRSGLVVLFRGQADRYVADVFQGAYEPSGASRFTDQTRVGFSLTARPIERATFRGFDALIVGGMDNAWAWPSIGTDGTLATGGSAVWTNFQTGGSPVRTGRVVNVSAAGDIDGDGRADVALHLDTHTVFFTSPDGVLSRYPRGALYNLNVAGRPHPPLVTSFFPADFNADGRSDLTLSTSPPGVGVALREAWGTDTRPTLTLRDADGTSGYGGTVAVADLNGDRASDLLVAAGGYLAGRGGVFVYVFRGGSAGPLPSSFVPGPVGAVNFGVSIVNLGDINGDGREDVAITSNDAPPRFAVYLGAETGLGASPAVTVNGSSPAGVGDVNGDRLRDVAFSDAGQVRVLFGGAAGLDAGAAVSVVGARTGGFLRALGDVNGDRLGDFLVGTPSAPQLVLGGATLPALDPAAAIPAAWVLEAVGDVNGDGATDLAAVGDVRTTTAATSRDITDIDAVARVYLSRVGAAPVYEAARSVALRLGPRDYWGAGQFTP